MTSGKGMMTGLEVGVGEVVGVIVGVGKAGVGVVVGVGVGRGVGIGAAQATMDKIMRREPAADKSFRFMVGTPLVVLVHDCIT